MSRLALFAALLTACLAASEAAAPQRGLFARGSYFPSSRSKPSTPPVWSRFTPKWVPDYAPTDFTFAASDPANVLAAPDLDDDDLNDDLDDDQMVVVDLEEVLESRAAAAAAAGGAVVDTQRWKPKLKKCKGGPCRRKCNAKGKNGACVAFVCVCWK